MSREQRRADQKKQGSSAPPPPSRRTPVKAPGGGGPPWAAIGMFVGVFAIVGLIAYLVIQSSGDDGAELSKPEREEANSSTDLPGVWFPSQGRGHFSYAFSLDRTPTPFCAGVDASESAGPTLASGTAVATGTAVASTPAAGATGTTSASTPASTSASGTPAATVAAPTNCYNSNPPSSGRHLNVQRNVDIGNGARINIPPDPDVYPSDIKIPREAIPHALEHAGIYVGYNCEGADSACADAVKELEDLVNDRIDNHDDRVIMANDSDLVEGTIALASWTRVDAFPYADFTKDRAEAFIEAHSCRIDWENFCR